MSTAGQGLVLPERSERAQRPHREAQTLTLRSRRSTFGDVRSFTFCAHVDARRGDGARRGEIKTERRSGERHRSRVGSYKLASTRARLSSSKNVSAFCSASARACLPWSTTLPVLALLVLAMRVSFCRGKHSLSSEFHRAESAA